MRTNYVILLVLLFVIGWMCFDSAANATDNDQWFLLATGREILENGIPYINVWAMHDDMATVVQQWIPAVVLYAVYSSFGLVGCKILVYLQIWILLGCLYALCRVSSGVKGRGGEVSLIIIACALPGLSTYWSVRPHLYTMIMFSLLLVVLEKYRRTKNVKLLIVLPVLTCIHVNMHMAMAPFDLFVIFLYVIPDVFTWAERRYGTQLPVGMLLADYPRVPLLIALVAAGLALLANPYGLKGALYLVESYGAADYGSYINEMGSAGLWENYGISYVTSAIMGGMAIGKNGFKRMNLPLAILFVVLVPLSAMHVRNIWLLPLFALPLIAQASGRVSLDVPRFPLFSNFWAAGFLAAVFVGVLIWHGTSVLTPCDLEDGGDSGDTPLEAVTWLDEYTEEKGIEKSSLRVFNMFNLGGYLEWHGYRVFMDPRPELWEPGITGLEKHYYQEYVDFAKGTTASSDLLKTYEFDFMLTYTGSSIASACTGDSRYERAMTGDGYILWMNKSLAPKTSE